MRLGPRQERAGKQKLSSQPRKQTGKRARQHAHSHANNSFPRTAHGSRVLAAQAGGAGKGAACEGEKSRHSFQQRKSCADNINVRVADEAAATAPNGARPRLFEAPPINALMCVRTSRRQTLAPGASAGRDARSRQSASVAGTERRRETHAAREKGRAAVTYLTI